MLEELQRNPTIGTIVLVARYSYYGPGIVDGLDHTVRVLTNAGKRVLLLSPIPEPRGVIPTVLTRLAMRHSDLAAAAIPRAEYLRRNAAILQWIRQEDVLPRVSVAWLEHALCERDHCRVFADGAPLYFDSDHLSIHGARFVLPAILPMLRRPASDPLATSGSVNALTLPVARIDRSRNRRELAASP